MSLYQASLLAEYRMHQAQRDFETRRLVDLAKATKPQGPSRGERLSQARQRLTRAAGRIGLVVRRGGRLTA